MESGTQSMLYKHLGDRCRSSGTSKAVNKQHEDQVDLRRNQLVKLKNGSAGVSGCVEKLFARVLELRAARGAP